MTKNVTAERPTRPRYTTPEHPHGDDDPILTADEVCALTRVYPATLRWRRHMGLAPASFKIGRNVRYYLSDVLDWLAAQYATTQRPSPSAGSNGRTSRVVSRPSGQ